MTKVPLADCRPQDVATARRLMPRRPHGVDVARWRAQAPADRNTGERAVAGDIDTLTAAARCTRGARPSSRPRPAASVGVTSDGVHVFKGIPYGASTAGANRFMPPRKPEPWTGVREAIVYAGRSPQAAANAQRPELATVWGPVDMLPVGEDCLTLHVWTPALDTFEASGHGLAAWRRLLLRLGQLAALRQHQARPAQRRRGRRRQPSPECLRPPRSLADRRRALRPIRQCRPSRSGAGAGMGARARPALRRRSGQCHDLRPVRRRREGERAAGDAARQGPLPQGDRAERRQRALRRARAHDAAGRRRAEASRPAVQTSSTRCRRCRWRVCRRRSRRRRRRCRVRAIRCSTATISGR